MRNLSVKHKIKNHLEKRRINYNYLYLVFVFMIVAIGIVNIALHTNESSYASEIKQVHNVIIDNKDPQTDKLFPRTKKEELLYEMIEKENMDLSPVEKDYIEKH